MEFEEQHVSQGSAHTKGKGKKRRWAETFHCGGRLGRALANAAGNPRVTGAWGAPLKPSEAHSMREGALAPAGGTQSPGLHAAVAVLEGAGASGLLRTTSLPSAGQWVLPWSRIWAECLHAHHSRRLFQSLLVKAQPRNQLFQCCRQAQELNCLLKGAYVRLCAASTVMSGSLQPHQL